MYVAIDPGINVGMAMFSDTGEDVRKLTLKLPQFRETLALLMVSDKTYHFIVEDFKLRKDKALDQVGADMPAARAIGAIEMMVAILGPRATITMVQPSMLTSALKAAGFTKYANNRRLHPPDDIAAYAHGVQYLIDIGLRRHPVLDQ